MFTRWLLTLSLIVTPYAVMSSRDVRDIKLDIAGMVAVAITLHCIYQYGIKPLRNKWLMFFMVSALCSYFIAPAVKLNLFGMNVALFWVWKPMYYFFLFFAMYCAISSLKLCVGTLSQVLRTMTWCGFIMGGYVILQFFGIDQVFAICTDDTYGRMAGFIGNPTHVSPFIAMIIPVCLYLRRYLMVSVMVVAICLTMSQVAILAMISVFIIYALLQGRRSFVVVLLVTLLLTIGACVLAHQGIIPIDDHERFVTWKMICSDMITPQLNESNMTMPMTGWGIGTFKYVFHMQHDNSFHQAHNDYLELAYNLGLVGLFLLLMSIWQFVKDSVNIREIFSVSYRQPYYKVKIALLSGIACAIITACGTFSFQIGTIVFYTVFMCGIVTSLTQEGLQ